MISCCNFNSGKDGEGWGVWGRITCVACLVKAAQWEGTAVQHQLEAQGAVGVAAELQMTFFAAMTHFFSADGAGLYRRVDADDGLLL